MTDVGKKVIEDLGFREYVWNAKKERTRLGFHCGVYSPYGPPNSCLLNPPDEGPIRERLLQAPVLAEILTCMITAWDPDFGLAGSVEMVEAVEKNKADVPVGWLTYLSHRLGSVPPLPAPVRVERVGSLGSLLILSPEPMTVGNPAHVAFTAQVREALDRAGLLARPEPS